LQVAAPQLQHYVIPVTVAMYAVFLVSTGGEALFAELGHFGRYPIRKDRFAFVLPPSGLF